MKKKLIILCLFVSPIIATIQAQEYRLSCGKVVQAPSSDFFEDADGTVDMVEYQDFLNFLEDYYCKQGNN